MKHDLHVSMNRLNVKLNIAYTNDVEYKIVAHNISYHYWLIFLSDLFFHYTHQIIKTKLEAHFDAFRSDYFLNAILIVIIKF